MPNFTNNKVDRAYENFMKQVPGFQRDPPEAEVINRDLKNHQKKGAAKMIFRNDNHGVLFEKEIKYHRGCSKKFTAALFLLTADTRLWHLAENHVGANEIDMESIKPRHLDNMAYVCYALARDIVTGSRTVTLADLADPGLISPRYFMVIQTAMVIRGYGLTAANRIWMDASGRQAK